MESETRERRAPWSVLAEAADVFAKATEHHERFEMLAAELAPLFPEGTRRVYRLGEKLILVAHDDEVGLMVKTITPPSAFELKWPEDEVEVEVGDVVDPSFKLHTPDDEPVPRAEPAPAEDMGAAMEFVLADHGRSLPPEKDDDEPLLSVADAVTDDDGGFPSPGAEAAEFGPLRGSLVVGGQIRDLDETA